MEKMESESQEKDLLTEYYDPVAIVLSGVHHDTENLTNELRKCDITYDQLSGLVEEDLRLMGMTKTKAIQEVLSEVAQLSNQRRMYDSVLSEEFVPKDYVETVCKNSEEHLDAMRNMVNLIRLRLLVAFPNNLLLEDRFYASEWSLKLCDKLKARMNEIESLVRGDQNLKPRKSPVRKVGIPLMLLAAGSLIVAVLCKKAKIIM